jgi:hypothetical protein
LSFKGNHRINQAYELKNHRDSFLEDVREELEWERKNRFGQIVISRAYCFECGQYITYTLQGEDLIPDKTDCFEEKIIEIDIPVPSGILLFADWHEHGSDLLKHLDSYSDDINCTKGTITRIKKYADFGVGHIFVGNTSPHIFEKDGALTIGRDSYGEDDEEIVLVEGGRDLGYVCTDLWWVTLVDKQRYEEIAAQKYDQERAKEIAQEADENCDVAVRVEPGTYRITYYVKIEDGVRHYADIRKL